MARKWSYSNAAGQRVGTMVCIKCNKLIDSGAFKWYENFKRDAYLSMHRECSLDDPKWAQIDSARQGNLDRIKERLDAYKEFRDLWDECALDADIESMEATLAQAA